MKMIVNVLTNLKGFVQKYFENVQVMCRACVRREKLTFGEHILLTKNMYRYTCWTTETLVINNET